MRRIITPVLALGAAVTCLLAQEASPTFQSVSIRRSALPYAAASVSRDASGWISYRSVKLADLIGWAYDSAVAIDNPGSTVRYDIDAKGPAEIAESKLMLRSLLTDRFKLSFHLEIREIQVPQVTPTPGVPTRVRLGTPPAVRIEMLVVDHVEAPSVEVPQARPGIG